MDPIVPTADAQPAGSSPAADPSPLEPSDSLESLSESQLHDWRMDGKLPSERDPTPTADSSPAPAVPDQPASTDAPIVAASEPAKPTKGADARIPELLADRAKERERADRAERRLAALEARTPPPPDARPAASSAAPAGLVKPSPESYTYGVSDPEYLEALTDYKVAATLQQERDTWETGQRDARQRDEHQRVATAFEQKVAEARTRHADFDAVAMLAPTEIPQGGATDLFVLEDPAGGEILYHLQQPANTAERRRILALGPLDQLKALVRLGDRLTAPADPHPRSTHAPPPPPTLGTRAAPTDPVARAIADDDFGSYKDAMNRRDLARLK